MRTRNIVFALLLVGAAVLLASIAYSQELVAPVGRTWADRLEPLITYAAEIMLAFAVTAMAAFLKQRFNVDIEARHRDALHMAANTGIDNALLKRGLRIGSLEAAMTQEIAGDAVRWMRLSVPDAVTFLKASDEMLREIALAKIGEKRMAAEGAAGPLMALAPQIPMPSAR